MRKEQLGRIVIVDRIANSFSKRKMNPFVPWRWPRKILLKNRIPVKTALSRSAMRVSKLKVS